MRTTPLTALCCLLLLAAGGLPAEGPDWRLGVEVPAEPGSDYVLDSGERFYLEIVDRQFSAVFFDGERLAVEPPVDGLILRGEEARNTTNDFNLALSAAGGPFLAHPRHFYPPYDYWFAVVILREGQATEVLPRSRFTQEK